MDVTDVMVPLSGGTVIILVLMVHIHNYVQYRVVNTAGHLMALRRASCKQWSNLVFRALNKQRSTVHISKKWCLPSLSACTLGPA